MEAPERRTRLSEVDQLKHDHHKLKTRVDQLKALDALHFLQYPADAFSPKPDVPANVQVPSIPGVAIDEEFYVERERRRQEMLMAASALDERFKVLLPPTQKPSKKTTKMAASPATAPPIAPPLLSFRPGSTPRRTATPARRTPEVVKVDSDTEVVQKRVDKVIDEDIIVDEDEQIERHTEEDVVVDADEDVDRNDEQLDQHNEQPVIDADETEDEDSHMDVEPEPFPPPELVEHKRNIIKIPSRATSLRSVTAQSTTSSQHDIPGTGKRATKALEPALEVEEESSRVKDRSTSQTRRTQSPISVATPPPQTATTVSPPNSSRATSVSVSEIQETTAESSQLRTPFPESPKPPVIQVQDDHEGSIVEATPSPPPVPTTPSPVPEPTPPPPTTPPPADSPVVASAVQSPSPIVAVPQEDDTVKEEDEESEEEEEVEDTIAHRPVKRIKASARTPPTPTRDQSHPPNESISSVEPRRSVSVQMTSAEPASISTTTTGRKRGQRKPPPPMIILAARRGASSSRRGRAEAFGAKIPGFLCTNDEFDPFTPEELGFVKSMTGKSPDGNGESDEEGEVEIPVLKPISAGMSGRGRNRKEDDDEDDDDRMEE